MRLEKIYNRFIFLLAVIGFFIALYVFWGYVRQSSILCLNSGCEIVRKSPYSYIFGIPIPGIGLVGYIGIIILAFSRTLFSSKKLLYILVGIAGFGFLLTAYFTFIEVFVIGAVCMWCVISAVIMTSIFIFSLMSFRQYETNRRN